MGFFSSLAGSLGGGIGTGLTSGINNHVRYIDEKLLGGALGIADANAKYLYEDTYNSGRANADASAYAVGAMKRALQENGFNPLLAIEGGINTSTQGVHIAGSQGGGGDFVPDSVRAAQAVESITGLKADIEENKERISSAKLGKEYADMELEGIQDDDYDVQVNGQSVNPTRKEYRQMIRNDIERRRYTNSREHAIGEDAVNAIHGGTSAFQNVSRGLRDLRKRERAR